MSCEDNETGRIEAAIAGDDEALARLLIEHSGPLTRRLTARLELNPFVDFSAEDVLQEIFFDVHRGIGTFRKDAGKTFSVWLQKVADNRLAAMLRARSRLKRGGRRQRRSLPEHPLGSSVRLLLQHLPVDDGSSGSERVARQELVAAIRDGLAALPRDQQTAVEQRYFDQRSMESTADAMQRSPGAVRGLIRRAKRTMRSMLGNSSRWFDKK